MILTWNNLSQALKLIFLTASSISFLRKSSCKTKQNKTDKTKDLKQMAYKHTFEKYTPVYQF